MLKKTILLFLVCSLMGCAISNSSFVKSRDSLYPPSLEGNRDILVFFEGDPPQKEYQIIGMVFAEKKALNDIYLIKPNHIINMLKKQAMKAGADAIIDTVISYAPGGILESTDQKMGEAKAIVFKKTIK